MTHERRHRWLQAGGVSATPVAGSVRTEQGRRATGVRKAGSNGIASDSRASPSPREKEQKAVDGTRSVAKNCGQPGSGFCLRGHRLASVTQRREGQDKKQEEREIRKQPTEPQRVDATRGHGAVGKFVGGGLGKGGLGGGRWLHPLPTEAEAALPWQRPPPATSQHALPPYPSAYTTADSPLQAAGVSLVPLPPVVGY